VFAPERTGTNRNEPERTGTNRNEPERTGTNRNEPERTGVSVRSQSTLLFIKNNITEEKGELQTFGIQLKILQQINDMYRISVAQGTDSFSCPRETT
jgi:hypothetical protein